MREPIVKKVVLIISCLFIFASCSQTLSWKDLLNKTIVTDHGFAGTSFTFLESDSQEKYVLIQVHGSGLPVIVNHLYTCRLENDSVQLIEKKYSTSEDLSIKANLYHITPDFRINDFETLEVYENPFILYTENDIFESIRSGNYQALKLW